MASFSKSKNRPDGLSYWCIPCMRVSNQKSYQKNKSKYQKRSLVWREENKAEIKAKKVKDRQESPEKRMLYSAKHRALQKGWEFDLQLGDIIIPEFCPVLGIKLEFYHNSQHRTSPSLDRIDSSKGYTKDNIQVISWLANTMKTNASPAELVSFAHWALSTFEDTRQVA